MELTGRDIGGPLGRLSEHLLYTGAIFVTMIPSEEFTMGYPSRNIVIEPVISPRIRKQLDTFLLYYHSKLQPH